MNAGLDHITASSLTGMIITGFMYLAEYVLVQCIYYAVENKSIKTNRLKAIQNNLVSVEITGKQTVTVLLEKFVLNYLHI